MTIINDSELTPIGENEFQSRKRLKSTETLSHEIYE